MGEVRVWEAATGLPVTPPLQYGAGIRSLGFSADRTELRVTTATEAVFWSLETLPFSADDALRAAEFLSSHHLDGRTHTASVAAIPQTTEAPVAVRRILRSAAPTTNP
jgi:hypothetical protein